MVYTLPLMTMVSAGWSFAPCAAVVVGMPDAPTKESVKAITSLRDAIMQGSRVASFRGSRVTSHSSRVASFQNVGGVFTHSRQVSERPGFFHRCGVELSK